MKEQKKLKVAVVGLRFGGEFPPIYRDHPDVSQVVICDQNQDLLRVYGDKFGFENRYSDFEQLLSADLDAVHIVTNIHTHHDLTIRALGAGLHTASTVPMATTLKQLEDILMACKTSGKNYMMMETAVYTFQFLCTQQLLKEGRIGRIQFLRGTHFQDMEGWPAYWHGLPPMHYATHAISPLLCLAGARATEVQCLGSGWMRDELKKQYGNPYPVETAIFRLDKDGLAAEASRSLFHVAREYVEGFTVFGDKASVEMNIEQEVPYLYEFSNPLAENLSNQRGREIRVSKLEYPDFTARLPESIRKFTKRHTILDPANPHQSITQGGEHHGSHPHLVHEFVSSILENRKPAIDAATAANWTAAGICAHESAMKLGERVTIPDFTNLLP